MVLDSDAPQRRRIAGASAALVAVFALCVAVLVAAPAARAALPPIKHVFVIVLENESESTTFGPGAPSPYLAKTLPSLGVFVPNYYAVGHNSLDNYIAMISGQAPNPDTRADCHENWEAFTLQGMQFGPYEQAIGTGCVYPSSVSTVANQLEDTGRSWKGYMQSMPKACSHPANLGEHDPEQGREPGDRYATRHDPFMWFQSITGHQQSCEEHVVPLEPALEEDLASTEKTPTFSFITPNTCYDGHESSCSGPDEEPAGFAGINSFLSTWVPRIVNSPAFKENGLLVVTFDEAEGGDTSACCGEVGSGGGDIGAVLVSPFIKPGTTSAKPYNHYSLLASLETLFTLPLLGDAEEPGTTIFGEDVFDINLKTATPTASQPSATTELSAPQLTDARESAKAWRERKGKSKAKKPPVGTSFSFELNEAASVSFAFDKSATGREVGRACVAQTKKNKRKPRCTRSVPVGTLNVPAHPGVNAVPFDGMLSTPSKLSPGSYTVAITATASGERSAPQTLSFTIAKG
jgi:hypothetical protein